MDLLWLLPAFHLNLILFYFDSADWVFVLCCFTQNLFLEVWTYLRPVKIRVAWRWVFSQHQLSFEGNAQILEAIGRCTRCNNARRCQLGLLESVSVALELTPCLISLLKRSSAFSSIKCCTICPVWRFGYVETVELLLKGLHVFDLHFVWLLRALKVVICHLNTRRHRWDQTMVFFDAQEGSQLGRLVHPLLSEHIVELFDFKNAVHI